MKNMRKCIAMFLLCAVFFCACSNQESKDAEPGKDTAVSTTPVSDNLTGDTQDPPVTASAVSAQDYYRYLNETFIPKNGLATVEPIDTALPYASSVYRAGGVGLASALIDDFNQDGDLEMLTVEVHDISVMDTFWNRVFFAQGEPYDPETRCLRLFLRHYKYEEDQIVEHGIGTISMIYEKCWGRMTLGIEKIGSEYFLFSKMNSENMMTSGQYLYTVSRIRGNSLSPIYTGPIEYGRANRGNYLDLMGLQNTINVDELSISDLTIPGYNKPVSDAEKALGNRLLCVVDLDNPQGREDTVVYQLYDYTNLRENLQDNGENWEKVQLPEGYEIELPEVPAKITEMIERIENNCGITMTQQSMEQEADKTVVTYASAAGNGLRVTLDTASNTLAHLSLMASTSRPDAEWYQIKDVLLQNDFGLSTADQKTLLGDSINMMDYMNGIVLGQYQFKIFAVTQATFTATLAS